LVDGEPVCSVIVDAAITVVVDVITELCCARVNLLIIVIAVVAAGDHAWWGDAVAHARHAITVPIVIVICVPSGGVGHIVVDAAITVVVQTVA
jgi:hypothetical protein